MGVTVPLVPTAPYYLCNLSSSAWHHHCLHHLYFFRKVFDFGCKQSPRKASAPQENRWHYLICRQASISWLQKKPGRLSDSSPAVAAEQKRAPNLRHIEGRKPCEFAVSAELTQNALRSCMLCRHACFPMQNGSPQFTGGFHVICHATLQTRFPTEELCTKNLFANTQKQQPAEVICNR